MHPRLVLSLGLLAIGAGRIVSERSVPRPSPTASLRIAITIDDAPWSGPWQGDDTVRRLTRGMIETLRQHHTPAAVFVNCGRGEVGREVLRDWMAAGATLGNHTTGHLDLHASDPSAWAESVRSCDRFLRTRLGAHVHWFRYPALHQGRTDEERDTARRVLDALHYRNAPVTIDDSDFLLAGPYLDAARAGRTASAARIGRLMLEHDSSATVHFRDVAMRTLGHDVPHVLLLHTNQMTADYLSALLGMLERMGATCVTLDEAMRDSIYSQADRYAGPKGFSWLYRIQRGLSSDDTRWDDVEQERLRRAIRAESR